VDPTTPIERVERKMDEKWVAFIIGRNIIIDGGMVKGV
jgi:hypothetical protein